MNNCRTNLDLVLFLGIDARTVTKGDDFAVVDGSAETFVADPGAALVGRDFAQRRGVRPGDSFRFGAIDVRVAGIFTARDPVKEDAVLTHLAYLQRAIDGGEVGAVTQFEVEVAAGADPDTVARAIDANFATFDAPTETFARSEFLARATGELANLVAFARLFGRLCVIVLCVLLANATLLAAAERSREHALMLAIGYRGGHVATTLLLEAAAQSLAGGLIGAMLAFAMAKFLRITIGIEGVPIPLDSAPETFVASIAFAFGAAALAATLPAMLATRNPVASALRGA
jgi:putative ABC transport system permease protein